MARNLILLFFSIVITVAHGSNLKQAGALNNAMANATVAYSHAYSIFQNQAGIAFLNQFSGGVSVENRFLTANLNQASAFFITSTKVGNLGLSYQHFGDQNLSESKMGAAFAKKFGNNFALSAQFNWHNYTLGENYGQYHFLTAEIGFLVKISSNLWFGTHISNPTRTKLVNYNDQRFPTVLRSGIWYQFSNELHTGLEVQKSIESILVIKAGAQYKILDKLFLRAGISNESFQNSFGFGYIMGKWQVDFSANYHPILGLTPGFGLYLNGNKLRGES